MRAAENRARVVVAGVVNESGFGREVDLKIELTAGRNVDAQRAAEVEITVVERVGYGRQVVAEEGIPKPELADAGGLVFGGRWLRAGVSDCGDQKRCAEGERKGNMLRHDTGPSFHV